MSESPEQAPRAACPWRMALVVAVVVAIAVGPHLTSQRVPIYVDEGVWGYAAWASAQTGAPIYDVSRENKPPAIFLLYRLTHAYDQDTIWRVRALEGGLSLLTALILLLWLSRAVSLLAGFLSACTLLLLLTYLPGVEARPEAPMVLGTTLGFYLLYCGLRSSRTAYFLAAGVSLGVGCCFKQVAVADLAAGLLAVALISTGAPLVRWQRVGLVLGGFAAFWAVVIIALVATHQFREFWGAAVMYFLVGGYPSPWAARAGNLLEFLRSWFPAMQAPCLVAVLAFLVPAPACAGPLRRLLGLWLPFAVLGFLASGLSVYYMGTQFYPSVAALLGITGAWSWSRLRARPGWQRAALALLVFLIVFGPLLDRYQVRVKRGLAAAAAQGSPFHEDRLGRWLGEHLPTGERIYVDSWGAAIYLHAQRLAASPYMHYTMAATPEARARVVEQLAQQPPAAIIFDAAPTGPVLALQGALQGPLLDREYQQVPIAQQLGADLFDVWLRRDVARQLGFAADAPGGGHPG